MSDSRHHLGKIGEKIAQGFLKKNGYRIVAKNFRTRNGEIDIIAKRGDSLIFIEVKARKSSFLNSPFDAVTERKKRQISLVAMEYLQQNSIDDTNVRFDVISITFDDVNKEQIEHIPNAFELRYGR